MAYFVRRLLENTANESFLRDAFVEGADGAAVRGLVAGEDRADDGDGAAAGACSGSSSPPSCWRRWC